MLTFFFFSSFPFARDKVEYVRTYDRLEKLQLFGRKNVAKGPIKTSLCRSVRCCSLHIRTKAKEEKGLYEKKVSSKKDEKMGKVEEKVSLRKPFKSFFRRLSGTNERSTCLR